MVPSVARTGTRRSQQRTIEPRHGRHIGLIDLGELRLKRLRQCTHVTHTADHDENPSTGHSWEEFLDSRREFHWVFCSGAISDSGSMVYSRGSQVQLDAEGHFDVAVSQVLSIRHCLSDAFLAVLGFVADHIDLDTGR